MKAIAITILAVTLAFGARAAYARCTDADKQACSCPVESANPPACRSIDRVNGDMVQSAAIAEAQRQTTATPLGVDWGCQQGNSLGSATCTVVIYFELTGGGVWGIAGCDVTVGIDGWGSTEIQDVSCGVIVNTPPPNNGSCTGGQCG